MHQNTFGGPSSPGPAGGAALDLLAAMRGIISKGGGEEMVEREGKGGGGRNERGKAGREEREGEWRARFV